MYEVKAYLEFVINKIQEVILEEEKNIDLATDYIADSCMNGGRFYVFGSGHSHMIAEEIYIRAGGLAFVKAILPEELMLHQMPNKSTYLERIDGLATALLNLYKVDEKDTILIVSNSGRNTVPVEMALAAKKAGMRVIAMTSLLHSQATTSRHKSGKKLYEVADVTIDNKAEVGDAGFYIKDVKTPIGATSDAIGVTVAQALIVGTVKKMALNHVDIPIFKSSNVDGADKYNDELFERYYGYWK